MTKLDNVSMENKSSVVKKKRNPMELRRMKIERANRATAERIRLTKLKEKMELRVQQAIEREQKCLDTVARHDKRHVTENVNQN